MSKTARAEIPLTSVSLTAALALAVAASAHAAEAPADHVFLGEQIITMAERDERASALAVRGERIVWVGERGDHERFLGETTEVHELGERALLPGFIDAHGHLTYLAASLEWANLAPPPVGPVEAIEDLQRELRSHIREQEIPPGSWVIGSGYDDSLLREERHPTRADLDAVSTSHPIALLHVSGHLAAANSAALAAVGIDAESADPPGGHIRREADGKTPNGVLEETATYPIRAALQSPRGNPMSNVEAALATYAGYGITTVQDGAIGAEALSLLEAMAEAERLSLDVVAYPITSSADEALSGRAYGAYSRRLKLGGVKLILDGSPQGKTAYLSQPYHVAPAGQQASYRGYPIHPQAAVDVMINHYLDAGVPVLAHANGDAAAEMLIDAVAKVPATTRGDHRTVMIHAQTVRDDQLDRMAELGIVPSFFSAHTFFWGDWHRDSVLGPARGARISPTRSAIERQLPFTVHNDAPIVPPDMVRLLWASSNRLTRSGKVLGSEQRLDAYEALRAVTAHAAYQYFEEKDKGTLAAGKLADLVLLSESPLERPPASLLELEVLETWSRGERVFAR